MGESVQYCAYMCGLNNTDRVLIFWKDLTFLFFQGITEMFRAEDSDLDGVITISYEKFLTILLNSSLL